MSLLIKIDILLFSFLLLVFLLVYYLINASLKEPATKLFLFILVSIMANCLLEALAWAPDGINTPFARQMNYWSNAIFMSINMLPIIAWITYFDLKIIGDIEGMRKRCRIYMIPFFIVLALLVFNHFTGWVFTISPDNYYTRGVGLYVMVGLMYVVPLVAFIRGYKYRERVNGSTMQVILGFMLLPALAMLIQLIFFGVRLVWPFWTMATIMAFIIIEKDAILKDSLTLLSTRGQLELRIKHKIKRNAPFSLMMIDLDRFKQVNDEFGHDEGDDALIIVASILEESVKYKDMVCRYGGDEFMILIESPKPKVGQLIQQRVVGLLNMFNDKNVKPYRIEMSVGVKFFESPRKAGIKEILAQVDEIMYANKASGQI